MIINEKEKQELREMYYELSDFVTYLATSNNKEEYKKCNKILNHYRGLLIELDSRL